MWGCGFEVRERTRKTTSSCREIFRSAGISRNGPLKKRDDRFPSGNADQAAPAGTL
jgi:hypothetical protein